MTMTLMQVTDKVSRTIPTVVGKPVATVLSCMPTDSGWRCVVETLERKAIPDTSDLLASYMLLLDTDGELLNFHRLRLRRRGQLVEEDNSNGTS